MSDNSVFEVVQTTMRTYFQSNFPQPLSEEFSQLAETNGIEPITLAQKVIKILHEVMQLEDWLTTIESGGNPFSLDMKNLNSISELLLDTDKNKREKNKQISEFAKQRSEHITDACRFIRLFSDSKTVALIPELPTLLVRLQPGNVMLLAR